MTDIPFLLLVFISAVSFILPLIAYIFRSAFPASFILWLGGIIWLMIFLTTDNIDLGQLNTNQTYDNTTNTIFNGYSCNCYPIRDSVTLEPSLFGILFIMLSLTYIMVGVLIERE